jgi:hypothetical protein
MSNKYITHDFKLPNHSNELSKAEDLIGKHKIKLQQLSEKDLITDLTHDKLYEDIIKILDYVGRLSMYVFDVEDEMERMYTMKYKHSPELGKELWLEHYGKLHQPYNLLKNRCFRMLEELDEQFIRINKSTPPNWNI